MRPELFRGRRKVLTAKVGVVFFYLRSENGCDRIKEILSEKKMEKKIGDLINSVSRQRISRDLSQLGKIGRLSKGYARLAYSLEESKAHEWLALRIREAGMELEVDEVGNTYGVIGPDSGAEMWVGSHLDTVPGGGNFDGVVGTLAGLEIGRVLAESDLDLPQPYRCVCFRCEEGSRFMSATAGSAMITGKLVRKDLKKLVDEDGVAMDEAMEKAGFDPSRIARARLRPGRVAAFLETHIEQGRVLAERKKRIGVVTGIAAPARFSVRIIGRRDHSGATPMELRRDAVDGAAEMITARENILLDSAKNGRRTVGTIGDISVPSGSVNVVAGEVEMLLDLRDVILSQRDEAEKAIIEAWRKIAARRGLEIKLEEKSRGVPVVLDQEMVAMGESACRALKLPYMTLPSGAGHDAMNMALFGVPTGMVFIPCKEGVSHAAEEFSKLDDIVAGVRVALGVTLKKMGLWS